MVLQRRGVVGENRRVAWRWGGAGGAGGEEAAVGWEPARRGGFACCRRAERRGEARRRWRREGLKCLSKAALRLSLALIELVRSALISLAPPRHHSCALRAR